MWESLEVLPYVRNFIRNIGVGEVISNLIALLLLLVAIVGVVYVVHLLLKHYLIKLLKLKSQQKKIHWTNLLLKYNVLTKLYWLFTATLLYWLTPIIQSSELPFTALLKEFIQKSLLVTIIVLIVLFVSSILNVINNLYTLSYSIAKQRPIKSYIDVLKIIVWVVASIFIVATIIESSPTTILTGLGALSAVLLLIFKDSIMGFVSSIQLSAYDIVRIGDWIELKAYNVDGDVLDISLNTVKIRNFNKTIVTLPTYKLMESGVINWRGMQEAGGRRIKRAIYIDIDTIKFCDAQLLNKLSTLDLLSAYISEATTSNFSPGTKEGKKSLTNVGLYRRYVKAYLKVHPYIHKDFTFLVRQLQPSEIGLPLEIYVFTNVTNWGIYEEIQSNIFDHLLAILPTFELKPFQSLYK
ncbi:MAG: mechanosensitive ion channel family protein [Cytophagales bacterium]|nr:mechanosensitive ion channel family protein [Cytophagales bacterium]